MKYTPRDLVVMRYGFACGAFFTGVPLLGLAALLRAFGVV